MFYGNLINMNIRFLWNRDIFTPSCVSLPIKRMDGCQSPPVTSHPDCEALSPPANGGVSKRIPRFE